MSRPLTRVHQLFVRLIENLNIHSLLARSRSSRFLSKMARATLSYLVNGGMEALTQFLTKHNSLEGTSISIEIIFTLKRQSDSLFRFKRAKKS